MCNLRLSVQKLSFMANLRDAAPTGPNNTSRVDELSMTAIHQDPHFVVPAGRSQAGPGGPCVGVAPLGGELNLDPFGSAAGGTKKPVISLCRVP